MSLVFNGLFPRDDAFAIDGDKLINWVTKAKDRGLRELVMLEMVSLLLSKNLKLYQKKLIILILIKIFY